MAAALDTYGSSLRGGDPITRTDLDNQLATLTTTLTDTLTATLKATLTTTLTDTLTATLKAESARRYNTIVLQNVEPGKSTNPLRRLPKTTDGYMDMAGRNF
eukprot:scaffold211381_cov24-Attheya_sp.AAC.1